MSVDIALLGLRDLVQQDIGQRGLARDPVDNLFTACPDDFANACRSIAEHPSPKVGIVTGFMIPTVDPPTGETDGPLGALFLARAFHSLGIPCELFSDASGSNALQAGLEHLQLADVPVFDEYLAQPSVTHLIALERSGPSRLTGRNGTMRGLDITHLTAPAHEWFEGPRDYVTIGIGDGGNEIGMGKIPHDTIARNIPNGAMIACRTATDHLIVAGISNWGAYALAAGVMLLRDRVDATLFDPENELRLLEHLVENGPLVDGVTGQRTATVDGLSFATYSQVFERIRDLLASGAA